MEEVFAKLRNGMALCICPSCEKDLVFDATKLDVDVCELCACGELLVVHISQRKSPRKQMRVMGSLVDARKQKIPISVTDISLQGVGLSVTAQALHVGDVYEIFFCDGNDTVRTDVQIVRVTKERVGAKFIFHTEFGNAKLAVRKIWQKRP